jgi:YD repeat-containing protein
MGHSDLAGDGVEVRRDLTTGHIQQVLQKTNADFPAAAALDHTWSPLYDGEKIAEIHDSDGRTAHYSYDREEYLTDVDSDGHRVHYDYDGAHRITQVVEDGHSLRIHYDAEGRADRVDFPEGSAYSIHYSGQAIEVSGPSASYTVTVLPTFFRTLEHQ